jgi:hypothetical protein
MQIETNQLRSWLKAQHARETERLGTMLDGARQELEQEALDDTLAEREHLIAAIESLANAAGITKYCTEVSHAVPQSSTGQR